MVWCIKLVGKLIGKKDTMEAEEIKHLLDNLNEKQRKAVISSSRALLVLAGAGTGKTRTLTHRIAYLILGRGVSPDNILAVTFTNKAAKAMLERIKNLVGESNSMWIGTFHSIAAKILRSHADRLGLEPNFTIIDADDQKKIVRDILLEYNIDIKQYDPKLVLREVNALKDRGITYKNFPENIEHKIAGKLKMLYGRYESRLLEMNACDFGGLLLHNITLFNSYPDITKIYQERFQHILVDEYQDINVAQYLWMRILTQGNNICCVGDDDQSIYGWRGAQISNILRFEKDFQSAEIIHLEKNYRSTGNILRTAMSIIGKNSNRYKKKLFTDGIDGNTVDLSSYYDDIAESAAVAKKICEFGVLSESAVLIRASYQTRRFEEAFNNFRIPYKITGGLKFYERAEVKDVVSYIKFYSNPRDILAFERIIAKPRRGIGNQTLSKIREHFDGSEIRVIFEKTRDELKPKSIAILEQFFDLFSVKDFLEEPWQFINNLLERAGYISMLKTLEESEAKVKLENVGEVLQAVSEFSSLEEYLEHVSLIGEDKEEVADQVNIMTIHAAKGLEFENVFLPGWEEGLFPNQKSIVEDNALEEERRLAYVAITRAKKRLYISCAKRRKLYKFWQSSEPSRFLLELTTKNTGNINTSANRHGTGSNISNVQRKKL